MIKNMLNKRVNKNTYIILTNIIFILSYKIGGDIAEKRNYLIRGWLDILYIGNVMTLIILGVISINLFLNSKLYSKIKNGSIKKHLKNALANNRGNYCDCMLCRWLLCVCVHL